MKMKRSHFLSLASGIVIALVCPSIADETTSILKAGEFSFNGGKEWSVKQTPRTMSTGGFTLAGKKEAKALAADFYHFGKGQGGTIDANIARWRGQFKEQPEPKKETLSFGDQKVHLVQLSGTFLEGRPFGPKTEKKNHAMLGAIIESDEGPVFVKLTGEAKAVESATEAFKKLCTSPFTKK